MAFWWRHDRFVVRERCSSSARSGCVRARGPKWRGAPRRRSTRRAPTRSRCRPASRRSTDRGRRTRRALLQRNRWQWGFGHGDRPRHAGSAACRRRRWHRRRRAHRRPRRPCVPVLVRRRRRRGRRWGGRVDSPERKRGRRRRWWRRVAGRPGRGHTRLRQLAGGRGRRWGGPCTTGPAAAPVSRARPGAHPPAQAERGHRASEAWAVPRAVSTRRRGSAVKPSPEGPGAAVTRPRSTRKAVAVAVAAGGPTPAAGAAPAVAARASSRRRRRS